MKAQIFVLPISAILGAGYFPLCQAQDEDSYNNSPKTSYDVHRNYDENGNLIYYDSVAVSTWGFDTSSTEIDSLLDAWEYGTPNRLYPFHYGFQFPGDPFGYLPEFEFDFVIPDLHDLQEGFEYNYSITPSNTLNSPLFPSDTIFHQYHYMPPSGWNLNIDEQIYQMEKFFEEFNERMEKQFYEPFYYFNEPCPAPSDSTGYQNTDPKLYENSYQEDVIHI